jgi:hypothetical protein
LPRDKKREAIYAFLDLVEEHGLKDDFAKYRMRFQNKYQASFDESFDAAKLWVLDKFPELADKPAAKEFYPEGEDEGDESADKEVEVRIAAPTDSDLYWVYQNVDNKKVTKRSAPTRGAWGLLVRARREDKVYQWVLDHTSPKTFADDVVQDVDHDRARTLTDIDKQLARAFELRASQLREVAAAWSEEQVA